ncbi:MAG TPA: hypothetical protein VKD72_33585, partial [Gemmataceae bacterium]|nr:hypothetical protein [Gemmataceae bacterium]
MNLVEDGAEFVSKLEVGMTFGEGGTGDPGGILGDGRDESELKRHRATSGRAMEIWSNLLNYMRLL